MNPGGNGGYERRDARIGPVLIFAVGLAVLCAGVFLLGRGFLATLERRAARGDAVAHPMALPERPPPGPRLQAEPAREYQVFRAAELERATTYGWIDREAGIVRVPIERAIELVLEEGLR